MGGGGNQAQQASTQVAQQQAQTGNQYAQLAQQQLSSANALEQPLVNFYSGIVNNQPGALMSAISPQIGQISQGAQTTEQQIMNNTPAGPGRDAALAQVRVQQGQQVSNAQNTGIQNAYQGLTQIGAAQAGVGISEANTGLGALGGSQQAYSTIQQSQATQKASTMGLVGSIVGGAAKIG
jgi:hypothetical protein